jgi:hypothetical protein
VLGARIEKFSPSDSTSFGENFFPIDRVRLTTVVSLQTALDFFIPRSFHFGEWPLVERDEK